MIGYKLDDETYEYIKEVACYVISHYRIKCIPISGFEIATKLRISLVPYSSLNEEGRNVALKVSKDGFSYTDSIKEMIFYNDTDFSYKRLNMTILHEVGHILLDHNGNNSIQEEAEANFFAKYIIAPPLLVYMIHPKSYLDIYNNFDISKEASKYSFNYFQCWYKIHNCFNNNYKDYEIQILKWYKSSFIH